MSWFTNLIDIFEIVKKLTDFNTTMGWAARDGHIEIVKLCREWGATDFNTAMMCAARGGQIFAGLLEGV